MSHSTVVTCPILFVVDDIRNAAMGAYPFMLDLMCRPVRLDGLTPFHLVESAPACEPVPETTVE